MNSNAHILVDQTLMPGFPPLDLDIQLLETDKLVIEKREHEIVPYASFEWAVPSIIFVFITKSYFDGFLSEIGANHYHLLKEWVCKQNSKFKGIKSLTVTSSESKKKISNTNFSNNFFAIYIKTPNGNILKAFMPECLSIEEDNKVLSELLDDLKKLYTKPKSKFARKINDLTDKVYDSIYAIYNLESKEWEFFTLNMLVHKSISK